MNNYYEFNIYVNLIVENLINLFMLNLILQTPSEALPEEYSNMPIEYSILFLIVSIIIIVAYNYWTDS